LDPARSVSTNEITFISVKYSRKFVSSRHTGDRRVDSCKVAGLFGCPILGTRGSDMQLMMFAAAVLRRERGPDWQLRAVEGMPQAGVAAARQWAAAPEGISRRTQLTGAAAAAAALTFG